ncbi:shikimate dehydrogenase [Herminiimonas sp. CN]|uniref:shikimate dehydrogenase n=1 Tax=Herminiimonas sp. CN TaxID=1349818 RepID=UPI000473219B|nr:shikimate dehydrogenase [Herminiimonas sp. CN]
MTDRYAVIGHPVAHSKSPEIHASFAAQTGQDIDYQRLLAPLDGFNQTVADFIAAGGRGANVTLPFKLEAFALATRLSARAQAAGAVNTLKFDGDAIFGDNTDGVGLVADIVRNAGVALAGRRILLLGAGGAARGVILPLLQQAPGELVLANRTAARAAALAQEFAAAGPIAASDFADLAGPFDIVINATAASLSAELPPVAPGVFGRAAFAYDLMYGKEPTVFMRFAAQHGAAVRDGLGMLVEQAAESFLLWRGVRPATAAVLAQLRLQLQTQ